MTEFFITISYVLLSPFSLVGFSGLIINDEYGLKHQNTTNPGDKAENVYWQHHEADRTSGSLEQVPQQLSTSHTDTIGQVFSQHLKNSQPGTLKAQDETNRMSYFILKRKINHHFGLPLWRRMRCILHHCCFCRKAWSFLFIFFFFLWCWRCKRLKVFNERPCAGYGFTLAFKKQLLGWFYIGPRGVITDGKILWDVLLHFWECRLEIVARIFDHFMIIKTAAFSDSH